MCSRAKIVRILLDAGANAQWKNSDGITSAHVACGWGYLAILQMLIHHDSSLLEQTTKDGETPLLFASRNGHPEICRFLMDRGCRCNVHAVEREEGNNALMLAARYGHLEVVRLLLKRGFDVHARDRVGNTALVSPCHSNYGTNLEVVRLLLQRGCDVEARNIYIWHDCTSLRRKKSDVRCNARINFTQCQHVSRGPGRPHAF
jgi:ankyrin repeat protein